MFPTTPTPGRSLLVCAAALAVGLGLAGCGRRGPLEPPPDASAPAATPSGRATAADRRVRPADAQPAPRTTALATQPEAAVEDAPDDDDEESDTAQSVVPSPNPKPRRQTKPYLVPKQPFILDPLL